MDQTVHHMLQPPCNASQAMDPSCTKNSLRGALTAPIMRFNRYASSITTAPVGGAALLFATPNSGPSACQHLMWNTAGHRNAATSHAPLALKRSVRVCMHSTHIARLHTPTALLCRHRSLLYAWGVRPGRRTLHVRVLSLGVISRLLLAAAVEAPQAAAASEQPEEERGG